jgi:uncharacterized protein YjbI with pentapeptide repeats
MANDDHVALLKKGVAAWNAWRDENSNVHPDLSGAYLFQADLSGANLSHARLGKAELNFANLSGANLSGANLDYADLDHADLRKANLSEANLWEATLRGANLNEADLRKANFSRAQLDRAELNFANLSGAQLVMADLLGASLSGANLSGASLGTADLSGANLSHANLSRAHLFKVDLSKADLSEADLSAADLSGAQLVETDLAGADLTGCHIYGVSAWNLKLEGAKQQNLVITMPAKPKVTVDNNIIMMPPEPEITVDNIEVAQFIYLLLHNEKVRDVIDTVTSKAVLILGRFTDERKGVLDALREELRKRDYLPILFDFAVPATRDITETVSLLARMARFIIADLTDPSSIPKELEAIVPHLAVPVQPLLEGSSRPFAMFKDYWKYEWVLPVYRYEGLEPLLTALAEKVIAPAEGEVKALAERRRRIEAELTKPQ